MWRGTTIDSHVDRLTELISPTRNGVRDTAIRSELAETRIRRRLGDFTDAAAPRHPRKAERLLRTPFNATGGAILARHLARLRRPVSRALRTARKVTGDPFKHAPDPSNEISYWYSREG